jgi:AsmA protein
MAMKMKRLLKIVASVLGLLIILVGATGIAIVLLFDPNDYKDEITTLVEQRTGRKLTLTGPITLSVFPWLGIEAGALALGNAPGFGSEPFLRSNLEKPLRWTGSRYRMLGWILPETSRVRLIGRI